MCREEDRIEDLSEVEAALVSLRPRSGRIDRDRLMFLAGRASAGNMPVAGDCPGFRGEARENGTVPFGSAVRARARWAWPAGFAAMSTVASALFVMLLTQPAPQIVERIVEVPAPGSTEYPVLSTQYPVPGTQYAVPGIPLASLDDHPFSPDSYHELLKLVLDHGLDAWKSPAGNHAPVMATAPATYRELLKTLLENPSA